MIQHENVNSIKLQKLKKGSSYVLFALLPLIVLALLNILHGGINSYYPSSADELGYWRELYNEYSDNNLVTGLNIYAGYESQIGNFSFHNISPTILWFLPGLVFGWHFWSIPVFNAFFVTLCFIGFLLLVKPDPKNLVVITLAYVVLNTVWLFGLSSMMEIPGYGLITLWTGALVYRYRKNTVGANIIICILYVFSGLYRIIFFVFFLPIVFLFIIKKKKTVINGIFLTLIVIASLAIYRISSLTGAPYPYGFLFELGNVDGIFQKIGNLINHFIHNIYLWFNPTLESAELVISRYAFILLIIFVLFIVIRKIKKRERISEAYYMEMCTAVVLCVAWVLQIAFYDVFDWRDFRILYHFAWFAIVSLLINGYQKYKLAFLSYFIIQIITLTIATNNIAFNVIMDKNMYSSVIGEIVFHKDALSRWDNTVYCDINSLAPYPELYLFPDQGIGITWGAIEGKEEYIIENRPGYLITKSYIDIPGYEFKTESDGLRLYIPCEKDESHI